MNTRFIVLFALYAIPAGRCINFLQENVNAIFKTSKFETLVVFGGEFENMFDYPRINFHFNHTNKDTLNNVLNNNILVILIISHLSHMNRVSEYLNGVFHTRVLIFPNDLIKIKNIFEKCVALNLENVIIAKGSHLFTYQPYLKPSTPFTLKLKNLSQVQFVDYNNQEMIITDDGPWDDCYDYDFCQLLKWEFSKAK